MVSAPEARHDASAGATVNCQNRTSTGGLVEELRAGKPTRGVLGSSPALHPPSECPVVHAPPRSQARPLPNGMMGRPSLTSARVLGKPAWTLSATMCVPQCQWPHPMPTHVATSAGRAPSRPCTRSREETKEGPSGGQWSKLKSPFDRTRNRLILTQ